MSTIKILFQGDSITDAGRDKNNYHDIGFGYAKLVVNSLLENYPDKNFEFINLGISGHQTCDLAARWQTDCIDLQPDIISLLIGINDTGLRSHNSQWLDNDIYEKNYRFLLNEIKQKTNAKILMLEQFLLPVPTVTHWRADVAAKIDITRRLAREFADEYIPLDGIFAEALVHHDFEYLGGDGVHPSDNGCKLIQKHYLQRVTNLIESIKK